MTLPPLLQTFFEPWSVFLAEDPLLRILQFAMLLGGVVTVFLVFYTTRDILLRSNSFLYMFFSILLVAVLPVIGFFLYLLIRPSRTLKEREFQLMVTEFIQSQKVETVKPKKPKTSKKEKDSAKSA